MALLVSGAPDRSCVEKRWQDQDSLAQYIAADKSRIAAPPTTPGSCWVDAGRLASLSSDYKAAVAGDLITIVVSHSLTSSNTGDVSAARTYSTSSGINSLPGRSRPAGRQPARPDFGGDARRQGAGRFLLEPDHHSGGAGGRRAGGWQPGGRGGTGHQHEPRERDHHAARLGAPGRYRTDNTVASNAIGDLELEIKGRAWSRTVCGSRM